MAERVDFGSSRLYELAFTHELPSKWGGEGVVGVELGWRFASFADGEGCFFISASPRSVGCAFVLKLRADDKPILERFRDGLGRPGRFSNETEKRANQSPQIAWTIARKDEVWWLCDVFDAFPLWSKKARDYAIWRDAVFARRCGVGTPEIATYVERLREVRTYSEQRAVAASPGGPQ